MKINHPVTDHEVHMKKGTILVTRTNLKGIVTFANDAFIEISGFSKDELIGANHNIVRHPDMPPAALKICGCAIKPAGPGQLRSKTEPKRVIFIGWKPMSRRFIKTANCMNICQFVIRLNVNKSCRPRRCISNSMPIKPGCVLKAWF